LRSDGTDAAAWCDVAVARHLRIHGVVQGVGFRPLVFRLAAVHRLTGWVRNGNNGVEIHAEGSTPDLAAFVDALQTHAPAAARITSVDVAPADPLNLDRFEIRESHRSGSPATRVSPDLPMCQACRRELFDPHDRRAGYPYVNCTECGPRYSIIRALPYDRAQTTMASWPMCPKCEMEYLDVNDRRFHAQPTACPACGPHYLLRSHVQIDGASGGGARDAVRETAMLLRQGAIVAIKGIGGYHLACDAANSQTVRALRDRKFRKDRPFAVMTRDLDAARNLVHLSCEAECLLTSTARPIVLAPWRVPWPDVAPHNADLGVMLPYTPLHELLFSSGAPAVLVMTSGNRSSEPIAYEDDDAASRLDGIADAWLVGERPIARRLDDSVARAGTLGPQILRRSRGYAPAAVARLPGDRPILALGGDLKNSVTLVVGGDAYVSQHIGDLEHHQAFEAFRETVRDLVGMYEVALDGAVIAHDAHPQYASTGFAAELPSAETYAVQHHRAHVASVLAEREAFDVPVIGVAFDGTGYGDDGAIWGGEWFAGSLSTALTRVAHLAPAVLIGGDAAARYPAQAAAGFVCALDPVPDLEEEPFRFTDRFARALQLAAKQVRTVPTTSAGRLFDTVAALLGFTRPITFEGQAAMWLEHLARGADPWPIAPMTYVGGELDWRQMLASLIEARVKRVDCAALARAFHQALADGVAEVVDMLCETHGVGTVVLSGGVMQNELFLADLTAALSSRSARQLWTNREVPPNDGGISLGQAALAVFAGRQEATTSSL
jgi:hydrogenase maturation protein HypF